MFRDVTDIGRVKVPEPCAPSVDLGEEVVSSPAMIFEFQHEAAEKVPETDADVEAEIEEDAYAEEEGMRVALVAGDGALLLLTAL